MAAQELGGVQGGLEALPPPSDFSLSPRPGSRPKRRPSPGPTSASDRPRGSSARRSREPQAQGSRGSVRFDSHGSDLDRSMSREPRYSLDTEGLGLGSPI